MSEHVYKVIELVGSSKTNIEDAVQNALARASETLRNSRWFEVNQICGEIENGTVNFWQVRLNIGFTVEEKEKQAMPVKDKRKETTPQEESKQPAKGSSKYRCTVCGYIYDPEKGDPDSGVKPGTPFEELPDGWICPECGVNKKQFEEIK